MNHKEYFIENLIKLIKEETGCSLQYKGCPCNNCFHTWAEDQLNLNPHLAHLFWIVILSLRGDYKCDEVLESNKENFEAIIKYIEGLK